MHLLSYNINKLIFHKNFNFFFSKHLDTHVGNTLLLDDTFYKSMFNEPFSAIFLESFDNYSKGGNYLL